ncbi:MAG: SPOR domain-containing protein [Pseudomonadota bacterium]
MSMDKVLKQRLIGASILIALAVIFLPMILVGPEEDMATDTMAFDMPARPADAREVRRIPLNPEAARVRESDEPAPRSPATAAAPIGEDDEFESSADVESPAEAAALVIADEGVTTQPDEIVLRPEAEPVVEPSRPAVEREAPVVVNTPSSSAVESSTAGGAWVVQVASFGSAESARSVRQRLVALGHDVMQDQISQGGNTLIRLTTGPYASEDAAARARAQIGTTVQGVSPIVRSSAPAAAAANSASGFAVQVGSFASQTNADRETQRLIELGFEAFRFSESAAGRDIWRVRVGPVVERVQAVELQTRLQANAGVEGLVVSHP